MGRNHGKKSKNNHWTVVTKRKKKNNKDKNQKDKNIATENGHVLLSHPKIGKKIFQPNDNPQYNNISGSWRKFFPSTGILEVCQQIIEILRII